MCAACSVSYNRLAVSIPRRVAIDVLEAVCLVTPGQIASSSDWLVSFRILVDTFAIAGLPDSRSPVSSFPDEPVVVRRIDAGGLRIDGLIDPGRLI